MSETSLVPTAAAGSAYDALRPVLQRFVDGVLAGEKPTDVVKRLRPKLKKPNVQASKWLARADVRAARAERGEQLLESVGITQQMIAREIGRIAFGDPRKLLDEQGNPKAIHELDDEAAAMIAGVDVELVQETEGEGVTRKSRVIKFKRWDKRQALRDLAELGGMKKGEDAGGGTIFNIQINL